jgi:hypothetical protein
MVLLIIIKLTFQIQKQACTKLFFEFVHLGMVCISCLNDLHVEKDVILTFHL